MTALSHEFEVTLSALAYGGEAIGRMEDGRAVFIPFALPGEKVRARIVEEKRGYVRAELIDVVEASPDRIAPRCIHFGVCGGCHYQHMSYGRQLTAKTAILRDQLERIGGMVNPPIQPIVPAPEEWFYRNHVQFHLSPEGKLGYLEAASHSVLPIQVCYLPEPAANETWPQLDFESLPEIERVGLRQGSGEDLMLILEGNDPQAPELSVELPISAVYLGPAGPIVMAGDDALAMEVKGRLFRVSAPSFFQVNTHMAEAMVDHLLELLPPSPGATVLDVYCGVGLFSAFLARRVGRVIGIEVSETACEDFANNLDEFDNVDVYQGAAEDVLPSLEVHPEVVLVDPPRAGIERRALDAIAGLRPQQIIYVSCDPSTLARDARRLTAAGYRLVRSTPFDLFPQTFHIESISLFER